MKKRRISTLLLATGALVVLATGCSKERERTLLATDSSETNTIAEIRSTSLRIELKVPQSEVIRFSSLKAEIQTKNETAIERLDIYQFTGTVEQETLEHAYMGVEYTAVKDGISLVLQAKGQGQKKMVFVANNTKNGPITSLHNATPGMTLEDFKKQVSESTEGSLISTPLLMVGEMAIDLKENMPAQTTTLQRVMARLDIKNYEQNLAIKRVVLKNVNDRTYLFHQESTDPTATISQTPTDNKVIDLPEVVLPTEPTPLGTDPAVVMEMVPENVVNGVVQSPAYVHYKHVLYPYVSDVVTEENSAPVLIVEGTLFEGDPEREHDVVYQKRLQLDGESDFLGFKRNHRYTVAIEGGTIPGEADIKLYVNEWNLVELPIEEIEATAPKVISITRTWLYDRRLFQLVPEKSFTMAEISKSHYLPTPVNPTEVGFEFWGTMIFEVSRNTDWYISIGDDINPIADSKITDWLSVFPSDVKLNTTGGYHFEDNSTFPDKLVIKPLEFNTTGQDRSVTFYLRSKVDPEQKTAFTFTQSAKSSL